MIIFEDINSTFIKVTSTDESEYIKLHDYFSIPIPGIEHSQRFRAGLMDGAKKFLNANGYLLWGLKQKAIDYLNTEDISYQDNTTPIISDFNSKEFIEFYNKLDLPFKPYKHQLEGVLVCLREKRVLPLLCTGSGKSLVIYILCRYAIQRNLKVLLLVPSISLVYQMSGDFKDYFYNKEKNILKQIENSNDDIEILTLNKELESIYQNRKDLNCESIDEHIHLIFGGQDKHSDKLVKISTRDSLSIGQNRVDEDYFKDIDMFIGDEIHRAGSDTTSEIIKACNKSYNNDSMYKIGLTGSLSTNVIDNLLIEGMIGKVASIIKMRELIDLGLATNVYIQPLYLNYNISLTKEVKKMKYAEEDKFVRTFEPRSKFIAKLATSFNDKNIMIIYKNNDSAEQILSEIIKIRNPDKTFKLKDYQKDNDEKVYLSAGSTKAVNRDDFRGMMEDSNGNILIGNTSIISTGINIKNVHVFIFANIGKSSTTVIQAIGRIVRLHSSKCDGAVVYDIVDNLVYTVPKSGRQYENYNFKHWIERLGIYTMEEFDVMEPKQIQLNIEELF